jgi:hypothetical protein
MSDGINMAFRETQMGLDLHWMPVCGLCFCWGRYRSLFDSKMFPPGVPKLSTRDAISIKFENEIKMVSTFQPLLAVRSNRRNFFLFTYFWKL